MNIKSLSNRTLEEAPFKAILYGPAGAGKTHLLRDFPKPLLYMDADDKNEPLIGVSEVDTVEYFMSEVSKATQMWRTFWKDVKSLEKDTTYNTVAFDSMTAFDKILVRNCVIDGGGDPMSMPKIQHYGDIKNWYTMFFNVLKAIKGKNIILLAHEDYKIDTDSGIHAILPLVTGSTSSEVASVFKDTWYLELKNTASGLQRVLHYQLFKKCVCTSTTLAGDGCIVDPTYAKLVAARRKLK